MSNQGTPRKDKIREGKRKGKKKRRALRESARIRYFSPKLAKSEPATKRRDSSFSPLLVRRISVNETAKRTEMEEASIAGAQTDGRYTYIYILEGSIRAVRVLTDRTKPRRFRDVD